MTQLGIALIGFGSIGRVHAIGYRALPFHYGLPADSYKIVGVATSRPETARQAAEELGCEVWTTEYRDLIDRPDVHIVDCCTPNNSHAGIVLAAAAAGKHIYCEKPLAMNVTEARQMVDAVERAGVKSQMTFNFRFFPAITRARQLIEEGLLGQIYSFRGRYYRASYVDPNRPLSWKLKQERSGAGALFDIGSHILDLIYYLLGDFGSVQATLDTIIKERPLSRSSAEKGPVDVDDIALLHLRLAEPAQTLGVVDISRVATGTTNEIQLEIYGDQGALRFDSTDPAWLQVYDRRDAEKPLGGNRGFKKIETGQHFDGQKAPDWTQSPSFVRIHTECQYQFLKAIRDDRPAIPSLADGLRIQEVMEAALRSSRENRWVTMEEVRSS